MKNFCLSSLSGLCLLGLLLSTGCKKEESPSNSTSTSQSSQNQPIKIGAIVPLTGDAAGYGTSLKKGMDLAVEEINKHPDSAGKHLNIVFEDDRNLPQAGVSAFNKLVSVDNVPTVLGAMFSAVTLAIAPIAESQKVVLLSPTSSAIELTTAGDYIFRIYPSDSYDGQYLATFANEKLHAKRVAVVTLQAASTTSISQLFKKLFTDSGGTVVLDETYQTGNTDFRAILTKINEQKPDLVFLAGTLNETAGLLRQAKELGVKNTFLGISTLNDPKFLQLAGDAADGVLFSSPVFDPTSQAPEMTNFVSAYRVQYGQDPDILAGYGYDTVNIAALAINQADKNGGVTPDNIKTALYAIKNYPGVTGKMSFDKNGDVVKDLRIMTVSGGKFVSYQ